VKLTGGEFVVAAGWFICEAGASAVRGPS